MGSRKAFRNFPTSITRCWGKYKEWKLIKRPIDSPSWNLQMCAIVIAYYVALFYAGGFQEPWELIATTKVDYYSYMMVVLLFVPGYLGIRYFSRAVMLKMRTWSKHPPTYKDPTQKKVGLCFFINYSTVTLFARLRGLSISRPRKFATWYEKSWRMITSRKTLSSSWSGVNSIVSE